MPDLETDYHRLTVSADKNKKKVLLLLPFYGICPPQNGGMQTCFNMMPALAAHFDLTVLMYQDLEDFREHVKEQPVFRQIRLYNIRDAYREPRDVFRLFPAAVRGALRYRWYTRKFFEPASSVFLDYLGVLPQLLQSDKFDYILFELVSDLRIYPLVKKYAPATKVVFQNHNVDSDLALIDHREGKMNYREYRRILRMEKELHRNTDHVLAVSENDAFRLNEINGGRLRTDVIQTGIRLPGKAADEAMRQEEPLSILFCGSLNYKPNYEGIKWFYDNCWQQVVRAFPRLRLTVIGSGVPDECLLPLQSDPTVDFKGKVPDVWPCYNSSAVVVVPLLSGSGIRLKILEAMSMGVPIVSTSKGAEGIMCTHEEDILIADSPEDFAASVIRLLRSGADRIKLGVNGRKLIASRYDWPVIGKKIKEILNV